MVRNEQIIQDSESESSVSPVSWNAGSATEDASVPSCSSRQSSIASVGDCDLEYADEGGVSSSHCSSSVSYHQFPEQSTTPTLVDSSNANQHSTKSFRIPLSKSVPNLRGILQHKQSSNKK